jgi:hypothetical protein
MHALIDVVETWNTQKEAGRQFTQKDMRKFIETMNDRTRHMISIVGRDNPEFYTGLFELAQNATTLTTKGAKIYGDGQDRTNL